MDQLIQNMNGIIHLSVLLLWVVSVNIAGETFTMHLVDFDMYFEVVFNQWSKFCMKTLILEALWVFLY